MNLELARTRASENLIATYVRLGMAVRGATLHEENGFTACTGNLDHPICNFAVRLSLDPWAANQLKDIARRRRTFNVYVLPEDEPTHLEELLRRCGFEHVHRMVQMEAAPSPQTSELRMREVTSAGDKFETARYMAEQFFTRQTTRFRAEVADATSSCGTRLFVAEDGGQRLGAVMLSDDSGALGIYNLCVSGSKRGQGIGGSIVRWALHRASELGILATLQCESTLSDWYAGFGFSVLGPIDVYRLRTREPADIMLD